MNKIIFETLKGILEDNKETEFGKNHHFSEINTIEEYKKQVPLSTYDDYEECINRMKKGEKNILTAYPVANYYCTSGTSGPQKLIPVTLKAFQVATTVIKKEIKLINIHQNEKEKTLFMSVFNVDLNNAENKTLLMSEGFYYFAYKFKVMDFNKYIDKDLMFDPDTFDFLYEKVWCGILEENLVSMESTYMYGILQFFNYLEKNYKEIISDIRNKRIDPEKKLSEKAKNFLLNLKYSEERLNFVEKECEKGFKNIATRIWKNFRLVSGVTSKALKYQNESLEYFIGDINIDTYVFAMSEGLVGLSVEYNSCDYNIEPTGGFFEFLPYSEDNNEDNNNSNETKNLNEVEPGKTYELVITTFSGLYRYKTSDILKIVSNDSNGVFFEFSSRKNRNFSFIGEKTNYCHLEDVMEKMHEIIPGILEYKLGATIYKNVGTYFLILCLLDKENLNISLDELATKFDTWLGKTNTVYQGFRNIKALGAPKVILIDTKEYSELFQTDISKKRHNKAKVLLAEQELKDILIKLKI